MKLHINPNKVSLKLLKKKIDIYNQLKSPLINNIKYYITNKNDEIEKELYKGNQWNNEIYNIIIDNINKKNLQHFLNIGSHIGTIALPISLHINKVTCIEAYPPTYKKLCNN